MAGSLGELEQIQFLLDDASVQTTARYIGGGRSSRKRSMIDSKSRSPRRRDNPVYPVVMGYAEAPIGSNDFGMTTRCPFSLLRDPFSGQVELCHAQR
jgi:hypothetical protein